MYHFNEQERLFLIGLCCVLFVGTSAQYIVKQYPHLNNIINVVENEYFYPKININSADQASLERIPYIGEYTAIKIIEYRQQRGGFQSLEELKNIAGIRAKNFERFSNYLKVK